MLQKQSSNIFGFSDSPCENGYFQKTASFFNPLENEGESSFSTQNTDATRENSSQSTPQQTSKGDTKKKICQVKRVVTVKLNGHSKNLSCANVQMPILFPQKSSPPLDKTPEEKVLLIRNCLSQESIRQPLSAPKELAKPGTVMSSRKPLNTKTFNFHQRTPSAHSNCQSPISRPKFEIESPSEQENFTGLADPSSNNKFVIRTRAKNKVKVTKFNKIKVISAIPGIENVATKQVPSLTKLNPEKKLLRLDTKKKNSLEISVEDIKGLQNGHAYSCHSRGPNAFIFPDITPTKVKGVSPVTHLCLDGVLPNTMSVPVTLKRIPSISQKCIDFEALKGLLEKKTYTAEPEGNLRVRNYPIEDNKFSMRNLNLASLVSPPMRTGSNIYTFKTQTGNELNTHTSSQGQEQKIKLHKRANPKFKNEEAVLDKLFNTLNPKKE